MAPAQARSWRVLLAAAGAFLLPVAYSPSVEATFWSPKLAVLLVVGLVGLASLPVLVRGPARAPAIAASLLVVAAGLSTLVSPRPAEAVFGIYNWGTGLVFVACLVGAWSLGVVVSEHERLLRVALLAGVGVSCGIALLQTVVDLGLPALEAGGRAVGLAGNPVHLGTIAVVGAALCAAWPERRALAVAGVAFFSASAQVSGTRFALGVLAVIGVGIVVARRHRYGAALAAALVVGVLAGGALASASGTTSATGRATSERAFGAGAGGVTVRLEVWSYARHAFAERPLLGHGPGRFRAATDDHRTLAVARTEGSGVLYADAHNLFVEHLVTTGLLGALALAAWLALAARQARGPLLAPAGAILLMALVQPQSAGTTPVLFLALGAASVTAGFTAPVWRAQRALAPAMAAVAVAAAGALLVGDAALHQARLGFDPPTGRRAASLLRPWPQPATILARMYAFRAIDEPPGSARDVATAESLCWRREAIARSPAEALLWTLLADDERVLGRVAAAQVHYNQALRHDRWFVRALLGAAELAMTQREPDRALALYRRAAAVRETPELTRRIHALDR